MVALDEWQYYQRRNFKDLKWMSRSGIGGFQNFDAALMTPQIVKNRLPI